MTVYFKAVYTTQIESVKKIKERKELHFCPVESGIEILSGKWKGRILWKLYNQPTMRFGELRRALGSITEKMLTQQLRELESQKLVNRKIFTEVPPRVEYSLTEFGITLKPIFDGFAEWGTQNKSSLLSVLKERQ